MTRTMKKKNARYKQCLIGRETARWTAWIPEALARVGKVIVPKGEGPALVLEAYRGIALRHDELMDFSEEYKHHRGRTDI